VLAVLTRLIGADLLTRLLQQAWPNGTFDDLRPGAPWPAPDEAPATTRSNGTRTPSEDSSSA
jgi:hypothetical protein